MDRVKEPRYPKTLAIRSSGVCTCPSLYSASTPEELSLAGQVAADAFKTWKRTSVLTRQRVMLDLQALIRENMDEIAESITNEQGKTFPDAKGDVLRGLQVSIGNNSHKLGNHFAYNSHKLGNHFASAL